MLDFPPVRAHAHLTMTNEMRIRLAILMARWQERGLTHAELDRFSRIAAKVSAASGLAKSAVFEQAKIDATNLED